VFERVRNSLPFQIRTLREQREWTQKILGSVADKPANVISRLEDPNYGKLTLKTLFELASAFECGLLIKFVPFTRLLREYEDVSPAALSAAGISDEAEALTAWATTKDQQDQEQDETETHVSTTQATKNVFISYTNPLPVQRDLFSVRPPLATVRQITPARKQLPSDTAQTSTVTQIAQ
jgi:hypothetical protein